MSGLTLITHQVVNSFNRNTSFHAYVIFWGRAIRYTGLFGQYVEYIENRIGFINTGAETVWSVGWINGTL